MEQIRIRQPKIAAAQSFIQTLGTFLAVLFMFIVANFSYIKNYLYIYKTAKSIGNTTSILKQVNFIYQRKNILKAMNLRI